MTRYLPFVLLLTLAAPRVHADALEEIEARYARQEISPAQYHRWRVLAVRAPERLPADLPVTSRAVTRQSGTRIMVEAFQWLALDGTPEDPLHALLSPPEDLDYSVDSTRIPLRVYYSAGEAIVASKVVQAAETSWALQVDQWGWRAPMYDPTYGPYRMYVGPTGSGVAGYTSPYGDDPTTPHADCYTYIFINPDLGSFTAATVAHEMNHAMQAATDCNEVISYWENTAVYVEAATFPALATQAVWNMYAFQAVPWRPLDYFEYGQGYQYGGALWNFYLADAYATPETGPTLLRDIWEASKQAEGLGNAVTYFDGINTVLAERTGEASPLDKAFLDFCEARYFTGERDDGAHIAGADQWWFAELALTESHTLYELPLGGATPPATKLPGPYGSNHIVVDLPSSYDTPIRVTFAGSMETRWAARVVSLGDRPTEHVDLPIDPATGAGEVEVSTAGWDAVLLVVANLGREDFKPGLGSRQVGEYVYDFVPMTAPPVITGADPPELVVGQQAVPLRLLGQGFAQGRDFRVSFEDPAIQVVSVTSVTPEEVVLKVTVPALTTLGPKSVSVTNNGGATGTGTDVIVVVAEDQGRPPKGCGCQGTPGATGALPWLLLLLGALAWRGRRRVR